MSVITTAITNTTSNNYIVHVYDRFGNGNREVDGSPFYLAEDETSSVFNINSGDGVSGLIRYQCEGGASLDRVSVENGVPVQIK